MKELSADQIINNAKLFVDYMEIGTMHGYMSKFDFENLERRNCWIIKYANYENGFISNEEVWNDFLVNSKFHSSWDWLIPVVLKILKEASSDKFQPVFLRPDETKDHGDFHLCVFRPQAIYSYADPFECAYSAALDYIRNGVDKKQSDIEKQLLLEKIEREFLPGIQYLRDDQFNKSTWIKSNKIDSELLNISNSIVGHYDLLLKKSMDYLAEQKKLL